MSIAAAVATAAFGLGSAFNSACSWSPPAFSTSGGEARSYSEQINPDGTCELVDGDGIPLYDSQFTERTGSSPCDQG